MDDSRSQTFATSFGLVTIHSMPDASRRALRVESRHHAFVVDHWRELAAASHGGYQEYGPGAVVLWRQNRPRRWRPRPFESERLWYATQLHTLPGGGDVSFDGWEARLIETYEPSREAVVVIVEGDGLAGYLVRGPLPPAVARAQAGVGLN